MKYLTSPRRHVRSLIILLLPALILGNIPAFSQNTEDSGDQTLSPYFFVMSNDTSIDQMPLKSTSADVQISGIIANVTVKQTYCNEGDSVLEAIYVFPASTRAAVHYMQMSLGYRILIAQIKEKEEAREIYEEAKEEGKTVTLLEQERPNVFKMTVGNILPGDTIEVEMRYTELLLPLESEYEFVYPTVVGPRYVSPSEDGESWTESPYQHEGEDPLYDFHINICINAGMDIKEVYSTSHNDMLFSGETKQAACASSDLNGNKDVVVKYRLSGAQIESGLLTYEGEDENFFLAMFQPPKNPQDYQIPPREYVFIMDVSGSMSGFPIQVSKALLTDLVGGLRTQDRFNLVFFAGRTYTLSTASLPASPENIDAAINAINDKTGGGGTELMTALKTALSLQGTKDFARTFVIITDGYVSVERQAFDLIRSNLGEANFFAFGIGSSTNRYIIEGIAHCGMGEPFIILNETEAESSADRFRKYIEYPVLTNIEVDFNGFSVYDVEPPEVPDVFAERPVILFGKYSDGLTGEIKIRGLSGNQIHTDKLDVSQHQADSANDALRYLWARYKIRLLDDYGRAGSGDWITAEDFSDSVKNEITRLGLKYNLLTQYTSFIAVDSLVRADSGSAVTVKQPLPIPEGVSNEAVGDSRYLGQSGGWVQTADYSESYDAFGNKAALDPESSQIVTVFPNPFSTQTGIRVFVNKDDTPKPMSINIYNALGQLIDVLDFNISEDGWHHIELDFANDYPELPAGLYSAVLMIGNKRTQPVSLLYVKS
ncbi:MAG TPA: VWA domain-containing protein [Bacteroides sp.]|nr:VWA domain-containing protein [Bacteroides sp.]